MSKQSRQARMFGKEVTELCPIYGRFHVPKREARMSDNGEIEIVNACECGGEWPIKTVVL